MPASSRIFAVTTGTAGLLAIAVLFLAVTPTRQAQPVAVSASTSPTAETADDPDGAVTIVAVRRTSPDPTDGSQQSAAPAALATPIGSGRFAIVLRASMGSSNDGDDVEVRLPSGRLTSGSVVESADLGAEAVLVRLDRHEPGHDVAERRPHERDVVTLMASPPITITLADLHRVDVADGTAVIDAEGHLVGLCTEVGTGGVRLVEVSASVTDAVDP